MHRNKRHKIIRRIQFQNMSMLLNEAEHYGDYIPAGHSLEHERLGGSEENPGDSPVIHPQGLEHTYCGDVLEKHYQQA